ncbi:MAG: dihydroorotate dehydrogenase electron transfer subunit [Pseudomonadota bacterium]
MIYSVDPGNTTATIMTAHVLRHERHHGEWHTLRLHAPTCAAKVNPGHYAQLEYGDIRYLASVIRTDIHAGWLELLHQDDTPQPVLKVGDPVQLMVPLGKAFAPDVNTSRLLLIGEGPGIAAVTFLAERLSQQRQEHRLMVMLGSSITFPFQPRPSRFLVPGMPAGVIAAMPLLEEWNIPSRLGSTQGLAGCFEDGASGLAHVWINALPEAQREDIAIFASGPRQMLASVEALAERYRLPYQAIEAQS